MLHSSLRASASSSSSLVPASPDPVAEIRAAFGKSGAAGVRTASGRRPSTTTWITCTAWARCSPARSAAPADLIAYAMDFKYEQIQKDLFLHVFPFCLQAWQDDLAHPFGRYETFVDELYPALVRSARARRAADAGRSGGGRRFHAPRDPGGHRFADRAVVQGQARRRVRVAARVHDLRRVCSPTSRRCGPRGGRPRPPDAPSPPRSTARACSTPRRRTRCSTRGPKTAAAGRRACGTTAATCWTRTGATPNLGRAAQRLTPDGVRAVLDRSIARLAGHPLRDKVASIRFHLDARTETLARRCRELQQFLATPNEAEYSFQWSV